MKPRPWRSLTQAERIARVRPLLADGHGPATIAYKLACGTTAAAVSAVVELIRKLDAATPPRCRRGALATAGGARG